GQQERAGREDRLRPPLRTHDVPGFEERTRHAAYRPRGARGRFDERVDLAGPHELLRDASLEPARTRPLAGVGSDGIPPAGDDPGEAGQPARRGEERTPVEGRQPAVW